MNPVLLLQSRALSAARLAASLLILAVAAPAAETGKTPPIANFTDVAEKAGLTMSNVFGGKDTKKYIIETTGTGVAIFDYDNDGWPDIFLVNGTTLEGYPSVPQQSRWNIFGRHYEGRSDRNRMGAGRVRGRLRQRRMGGPLRHLLRQKSSLSQSEWSLHRDCGCVRRGGNREGLGNRMRLR